MHAFWSGVVAGYGIAVPIGAVGAYLVALTARTSLRVGVAAALGVASADGLYALLAVVGGTALASALAAVAGPLRWVAVVVLLALAVRVAVLGVREHRGAVGVVTGGPSGGGLAGAGVVTRGSAGGGVATDSGGGGGSGAGGARVVTTGSAAGGGVGRTFLALLGTTLLNPATVVYFAALVIGGGGEVGASPGAGALFVAGALLASASWQLLLVLGGSGLGRVVTTRRGRLVLALTSAALIAALAVTTLVHSPTDRHSTAAPVVLTRG